VKDRSSAVVARYPGGSLFQGLGRPWSGLHTLDTIRRDAAGAGIAFSTRLLPDGRRVEIVLHGPQGVGEKPLLRGMGVPPMQHRRDADATESHGQDARAISHTPSQIRLTYRIHLYQDWIETIVFSKEDMTIGEWTFSYPKPGEADPREFAVPSPPHSRGPASGPNGLWLMRLAQGNLVQ
jgi:hypothetical protein